MYLGGRGHDVEVRGSSATGAYASGGASWPDPETRRDASRRFSGYLHCSTNWLRIPLCVSRPSVQIYDASLDSSIKNNGEAYRNPGCTYEVRTSLSTDRKTNMYELKPTYIPHPRYSMDEH